VAVDRGRAVIAGFHRGRVVLARLNGAGRPIGERVLGRAHSASDLRIALVGGRVAVAWLEDQDAIVLARTQRLGGPIHHDRLDGHNVDFHELAMNARGVVVDAFKDSPDFDDSGVSVLVASPGHPAQRTTLLSPTPRNPNEEDVQVDAAGRFHVSWEADGPDSLAVLGTADADANGTFGLATEQDLGSSLYALQVRTASNGSQVAAYQRRSDRADSSS
jgi:hypothetical protein